MAKRTKRKHRTAYRKATDRLETEGRSQCFILYGSTAIALWRYWGKRTEAITNLFLVTSVIWNDCAQTIEKSMIQMCEAETGIEVRNLSGKSWRELKYLNRTLDTEQMSNAEWVYMRHRQKDWLAPQIMACIMIALHRKYRFGFDRLSRIYAQIDEIRTEYGNDAARIREACKDLTKIDVADATTKQGEQNTA